jgi:hypothetical protein
MSNNYQQNIFTQQNSGWQQQQQPIFGQSSDFVLGSNDFPSLDT